MSILDIFKRDKHCKRHGHPNKEKCPHCIQHDPVLFSCFKHGPWREQWDAHEDFDEWFLSPGLHCPKCIEENKGKK